MKKLHIKSFGCQMNKLDSSLVSAALTDGGFEIIDSAEGADVVLINTCSVRNHAEEKVMSHLGRLKVIKKTNPDLVVGVIGCMAQRIGEKLLKHPVIDIVAGPSQIPQIPSMVAAAVNEKASSLAVTDDIREKIDQDQSNALDNFEMAYDSDDNNIPGQAFARIMRGCNNFCTYCIVPFVRGPEVSRPPEAIVKQIEGMAEKGVKQITLLGQTVNAYQYTAGDKTYRLADLLELVSCIDGIEWIRFITSHPKHFDDSILRAMADIPKVCRYLHMPAQSGSDRILKAMNRNYTSADYLGLIVRARTLVPDIAIAGDFIVGFPGETDEDFAQTVKLVEQAKYKNCFVFKYSPRPGTNADKKLADTISNEVKKQRNCDLLEVQNRISEDFNRQFEGQTLKVLVEGLSKKPDLNRAENDNNPQLMGRTATDYIVVFNGPESLAGDFAQVKITKTSPLTLFGHYLYKSSQ
jgi:tRNA-2-methylthio-N6-dimethylallyladenosine synthase